MKSEHFQAEGRTENAKVLRQRQVGMIKGLEENQQDIGVTRVSDHGGPKDHSKDFCLYSQ